MAKFFASLRTPFGWRSLRSTSPTLEFSRLRAGKVRHTYRYLCQQGVFDYRGGSKSARTICWAAFTD
ncbi:MAG: hypothetical protein GY845_28675 [Planctomycetes bacterium]|nr:hypothetical protein [Planctomycetota bacterium]